MKVETRKQNTRREQLMLYAPLLIWIGVIFFLSSSQGSLSQTSRIIRPILQFLFPSAPEETLLLYHGYIRKLAHFSEYAVLGFFAIRALAGSALNFFFSYRYVFAVILLILVAVLDEVNQSFNPARTGSAFDVLIDISGGLIAIAIFYFWTGRLNPGKRAKPDPIKSTR